jgi:hypothetical protein
MRPATLTLIEVGRIRGAQARLQFQAYGCREIVIIAAAAARIMRHA